MKKTIFYRISILILIGFILSFSINSFAKEKKSIAIIPFEIFSQKDITYIQSGILQMLYSRLAWKDHVSLVKKSVILKHLGAVNTVESNHLIKKVADLTGSDYVLTGSITCFSNAFSIDTKIYDIKNLQYMTFSEHSKVIDDIIPDLNTIAARINKKVFQRETIAWDELGKRERERAQQWKRQNPEKMMPVIPKGIQEEKSSFWKIWKYL